MLIAVTLAIGEKGSQTAYFWHSARTAHGAPSVGHTKSPIHQDRRVRQE